MPSIAWVQGAGWGTLAHSMCAAACERDTRAAIYRESRIPIHRMDAG